MWCFAAMGIKNGASDLISSLERGLYHKNAKNYKIIIDGELMRYKGMIECNLSKHNAEEAIAATSFDYMNNVVSRIELFLGREPLEVIVFMDGTRVFNKESGRADFHFDAHLIRSLFKKLCQSYGFTVTELMSGESELQMYLKRDQTLELNVFVTNDSDMISICYGHRPKVTLLSSNGNDGVGSNGGIAAVEASENVQQTTSKKTIENVNDLKDLITVQASKSTSYNSMTALLALDGLGCNGSDGSNSGAIEDKNLIYDIDSGTEKFTVADSCVWVNCSRQSTVAIGFDFIADRFMFNVRVFRIFVALCGTDFTNNLLTSSMIAAILQNNWDSEDLEYINSLTRVNEIVAALILLGLRANGTIKRLDMKGLTSKLRFASSPPSSSPSASASSSEDQQQPVQSPPIFDIFGDRINYQQLYNSNLVFNACDVDKSINMYLKYIATGEMENVTIPRPNMGLVCRHFIYAMRAQDSCFVKKALNNWSWIVSVPEAIRNLNMYLGTYNPLDCSDGTKTGDHRTTTAARMARKRPIQDC